MGEITKVVFVGGEGDGKSLEMAKTARVCLYRNARAWRKAKKYNKKNPLTPRPVRPLVSNMKFKPEFEALASKFEIPIIYFDTLHKLIQYVQCDVFIDELSKYYDSHRWKDLTIDALTWITQGGKQGIVIYASTQDFSSIAKGFRVITSRVFQCSKIAGSKRGNLAFPPPRIIWGFVMIWRVNPKSFRGDNVTMETIGWPAVVRIRRKDTKIYDTFQKINRSPSLPLEHYERYCPVPGCKNHTVPIISHA